jgi:hypothetical protein
MADSNRLSNKGKSDALLEVGNLKTNVERKDKRISKLKESLEGYRNHTLKLVTSVELELERLKGASFGPGGDAGNSRLRQESARGGSPDDSPGRSPAKTRASGAGDNVWFDIEKSQERYEALLDSYQNIIKDKDTYLGALENDLANAKHERLSLEDEHFNAVREKDRMISDAESGRNDAVNQMNNFRKEMADKINTLNTACAQSKTDAENAATALESLKKSTAADAGMLEKVRAVEKSARNELDGLKSQLFAALRDLDAAKKDV